MLVQFEGNDSYMEHEDDKDIHILQIGDINQYNVALGMLMVFGNFSY